MKKNFLAYTKIILGSCLIAAGIYFFMAPAQFAAGGISGIAIVLRSLWPLVPMSAFILALDCLLFLTGFFMLGARFGARSIISSLCIAAVMRLFELLVPNPPLLSSEHLVILFFGCLCIAFGQAVIFNQNASSGGTDIVAKIIARYTHLKIGTSLLIADMCVVLLAAGQFGIEKGLYAALGVLLSTTLIDYFISGFTVEKYVVIIPTNENTEKKIADFILNTLGRGATTYDGRGAYSNQRKTVITSVISIREFVRLRQFIATHDATAFVTVQNLHEVMGEGFEKHN